MENTILRRYLVILLLISIPQSQVFATIPEIGVKKGDTFDFILEKYSSTENDGYHIGRETGVEIYAKEMDQITITVTSDFPTTSLWGETPIPTEDSEYYIPIDVNLNNHTVDTYANLNAVSGWIITTDLNPVLLSITDVIDSFDEVLKNNQNYTSDGFSLINTETEIGYTASYYWRYTNNDTLFRFFEVNHEKSNGVLLSLHSINSGYWGDSDTYTEFLINRKENATQKENASQSEYFLRFPSLKFFIIPISVLIFFVIIYAIYRIKNQLEN